MPTKTSSTNRHPVDKLFDLREQIKALTAEADALRADVMRSGDFVGTDYLAVPKTSSQRRLDRPSLELAFGKDKVDACCKEISVTTLNLFKKADVKVPSVGLLD